MKKIFSLLFLTTLLISCVSPSLTPTSDPGGSTRPALTDPSQPIEVQAGETFNIVLVSNASTGYHWEVTSELDSNLVELVSREFTADEPVMPGSGGVDVWIFNAVASGEAQITIGNYPPGVAEGDPEESVTFTILIK